MNCEMESNLYENKMKRLGLQEGEAMLPVLESKVVT